MSRGVFDKELIRCEESSWSGKGVIGVDQAYVAISRRVCALLSYLPIYRFQAEVLQRLHAQKETFLTWWSVLLAFDNFAL